jgi:voltage-gated potassium channel
MKFLSGHLAYAIRDEQLQRNVGSLLKYAAFVSVVILLYAVIFHVIMGRVEGVEHSWVTGIYWTLTVMSTLGFGDITFTSDVGRMFSILVLMSGIVLLLIVLPFAFIRYFYAPWLEARLRLRAPTAVPAGVEGHVVLTAWDGIAEDLVRRLGREGTPYYVIEPDANRAAAMHGDGVSVVRGEVDDVRTYERLAVERARLVVVNHDDLTATNVVLTVRELSEAVPVVALAEEEHSVDILELGGASDVLLLKTQLGEQLASRVNAGHAHAYVLAEFQDLLIAEFSVHGTPLVGRTIEDSRLREIAGVNIAGVWEKGRMISPRPGVVLTESSLPIVSGSRESIERLNEFLYIYDTNWNPILVLGGGKVGRAAARHLKEKGLAVHLVEQDPAVAEASRELADRLIVGNAADREIMREAGIEEAPSVLLTTNDDATNIYLAAYCRRLSPETRVVSRITHDRNMASILRAGADFTLSYATLGAETLYSILRGRPPMILGEDVTFYDLPIPESLAGTTLGTSGIGRETGLTVLAIEQDGRLSPDPGPETPLASDAVLLAIGRPEQVRLFRERYRGGAASSDRRGRGRFAASRGSGDGPGGRAGS